MIWQSRSRSIFWNGQHVIPNRVILPSGSRGSDSGRPNGGCFSATANANSRQRSRKVAGTVRWKSQNALLLITALLNNCKRPTDPDPGGPGKSVRCNGDQKALCTNHKTAQARKIGSGSWMGFIQSTANKDLVPNLKNSAEIPVGVSSPDGVKFLNS